MIRRTVYIQLTTSLDDTPEGERCDLCGSLAQKSFINHQVSGDSIVLKTVVPGYRCPNCKTGFYSHKGILESLTKAQELLAREGDLAAQHPNESIDYHKKFVFPD